MEDYKEVLDKFKDYVPVKDRNKLRIKENTVINEFPKEVFNKYDADGMERFFKLNGFDVNFSFTAFLVGLSASIGNRAIIHHLDNWYMKPNLFAIGVGKSGMNKSAPLKSALTGIQEFDRKSKIKYKEELELYKEYETYCKSVSKKSDKKKLIKDWLIKNGYEHGFEKPTHGNIMQDVITKAAIIRVLNNQRNGIVIDCDEFDDFLKNVNKDSHYGSVQFWCKAFDGSKISNTTANNIAEELESDVYDPYISMLGATQTERIGNVFSEGNINSGFVPRILFTILNPNVKISDAYANFRKNRHNNYYDYLSFVKEISFAILENDILFDETGKVTPHIFRYDENIIEDVEKFIIDHLDNYFDDSYAKKMNIYIHKFSLILKIYENYKNTLKPFSDLKIGKDTFLKATELLKFYLNEYQNITIINSDVNVLKLNKKELEIYSLLPDSFKSSEGQLIAKENDISQSTYYRHIKNLQKKNVLNREGTLYQKLY